MKTLPLQLLVCSILTGLIATARAGEPPAFAEHCLSCHGPERQSSAVEGPQLAGLKQDYILRQLHHYQQGLRGSGSPAARAMAEAITQYSAEQLDEIADWAADLEGEPVIDFSKPAPETGAGLFGEHCRGCHQAFMGRLMTGSPRLEYLDGDYLNNQLDLFISGDRQIDQPDKHQLKMIAVTRGLSDQEVEAIKAFIKAADTTSAQ